MALQNQVHLNKLSTGFADHFTRALSGCFYSVTGENSQSTPCIWSTILCLLVGLLYCGVPQVSYTMYNGHYCSVYSSGKLNDLEYHI